MVNGGRSNIRITEFRASDHDQQIAGDEDDRTVLADSAGAVGNANG
jgi:hypothetical protein